MFDGASFVGRRRRARSRSSCRRGTRRSRCCASTDGAPKPVRGALDAALEAHVYAALVMGVRDYVGKNRFPGVLLGLVGRRRFGADAGGRRRRARAATACAR